ncbi:MAG: biopolymer transporter ExbD [Cyclobacteriaceae bacterium]
MGKFRKSSSKKTQISTASLPDIVFLLLFFFMVSATIKTQDDLVDFKAPNAENLTKSEKKFLIKELNVGFPKNKTLGHQPRISDGEKFIAIEEVAQWAESARQEIPENYRDQMIVLLKSDLDVDMGLIADIQEQLRTVNARKIVYRSNEHGEK